MVAVAYYILRSRRVNWFVLSADRTVWVVLYNSHSHITDLGIKLLVYMLLIPFPSHSHIRRHLWKSIEVN
ncbi:hypothetical protein XELAEV_18034119mg [Xenopus laevis]|uniref:Uncharacterized protein n=1 Tax=Xenopus laevis TaxID=8355 RepID=A0A974CKK6_XENLA|nr:hypothetical protein XELAEV_18034119mg [Xenopus laevis]